MSYRSFKRVLGETNLERKCLVLFAACLFLLITGAFWYAERKAEGLVQEKTRAMGESYVNFSLVRHHIAQHDLRNENSDEFGYLQEMDRELSTQNYDWEILIPQGDKTIEKELKITRPPRNDRERAIMIELRQQLEQQIRGLPAPADPDVNRETRPVKNLDERSSPDSPATVSSKARAADSQGSIESNASGETVRLTPVSRLDRHKDNYYYYQPVYWKETCVLCHIIHQGAFIPLSQESRPELRGPLRIIKVTLPSEEAQLAITKSRAFLLATAIITVFLAVITLYLVVRYVIVKPLNHLRHVSDEISRGNTTLCADIQTNDEFEDLAASFNRMLRHLIDTQEELRKVNTDLDGKLDQLAQANMQLHEMNRLRSDFLANMSHELRTPLNSIIGFSDVLKGIDALNDKQQRYVDNIGNSGRILLEMINDILDLAKMESGKMDVRLTEFSIEPVINAQCDLVRALSEEKNIDLVVQVDASLPPLYQDQGKVQQILTNLLSNAIKFTPEGGRIVVSARREPEGDLRLTVEDTGVGIAEEDRQIIFEKFRQGTTVLGSDTLTRQFSGTGLGLSIVKELCRLLGGEIVFESELGKGSTFTAQLPWRRKEVPHLQSSLTARLDEVTKSQRIDVLRGTPAVESTGETADEDQVARSS